MAMTSTYSSSSRTNPFLRNYSQKKAPDVDVSSIVRSVLLDGTEHIVSHEGTSQYNKDGSGAAACGLAALNFARVAFLKEQDGLRDGPLLQAVLSRECVEEVTSVCALWSGNLHLEVEEICRIPLFDKTLKLKDTTYGQPGVHHFKSLLTNLIHLDSSAVVIITRPPEIIACLKLRLSSRNVFIIFDSHPRPSYPNGAGAIVSTSAEYTARRLTELLPTVDLHDGVLQWQAQLLSNCSGHVFVPHGLDTSTAALWQAVLESSLAQLHMQAEISDLRSQNEFQVSEQERLETELKEMEERCRRQERAIQELRSLANKPHSQYTSTSQRYSTSSSSSSRPFSPSSTSSSSRPFSSSSPKPSTSTLTRYTATSQSTTSSRGPPTPPFDWEDGITYARRLQNEFDNEDHALSAERIKLSQTAQRVFECGICMEEMPEDSVARPDPCGHAFCRDCMRGYVSSRLEEHRFPILCPTCTAGKGKNKGITGEVSQGLALNLGLTDEQFNIWTEMQMVSFSVLLHCRQCKRSMFVARDEHEEVKIIACPLPDCNHAWCKQCEQTIDFSGPQHSCDGTTELDHLMKQQGWKYCPSCKTPIQKVSGCNHMSCMTPACNTHFCYLCGDLIVKSALGQEIKEATTNHYRSKCQLFAVPDE